MKWHGAPRALPLLTIPPSFSGGVPYDGPKDRIAGEANGWTVLSSLQYSFRAV